MPSAIDVFGISVLVLGVAALGLSVLFEASRLAAAAGRQALVRRRIQGREREKLDLAIRLDGVAMDEAAKQATLDGVSAERARISAATTGVTLSKIEMVHAIGDPEPGTVLFQGALRADAAAGRMEQRRVVFARAIWDHTNTAHVWAETSDAAMAAIQRAFDARSAIVATRVQRSALARPAGRMDGHKDPGPAGRATDRPALRMAVTPGAA